ncbi:hypothetical protein FRC12_006162 [Ceratobasidium sp. 428]|nr:hypothetical protein FRC12_006162 [Ceratobasidium sp. 428]
MPELAAPITQQPTSVASLNVDDAASFAKRGNDGLEEPMRLRGGCGVILRVLFCGLCCAEEDEQQANN